MNKKADNYIVKKLELELLSPKTRKSPKRLNELLADDFFEFTQSGLAHSKQNIIGGLPKCPEENFIVHDYTEKVLSADLVLVHYIANREIMATKEKRRTLCSSIWQNKKTIGK